MRKTLAILAMAVLAACASAPPQVTTSALVLAEPPPAPPPPPPPPAPVAAAPEPEAPEPEAFESEAIESEAFEEPPPTFGSLPPVETGAAPDEEAAFFNVASAAPEATPGNCETLRDSMPANKDRMTCVSLFYGTNRVYHEDGRADLIKGESYVPRDLGEIFGGRVEVGCDPNADRFRDLSIDPAPCHMGEVIVSVPDSRRELLKQGGGAFKAVKSGQKVSTRDLRKKFALLDHTAMDEDPDLFEARVAQALENAEQDRKHVFIFIHGFNEPFRNVAFRTAQLKYDMNIEGPVFFFSWPSNGRLFDYLNDQEDADLSVDALARFLVFVNRSVNYDSDNPVQVNIIAHSMGTRITAQALARLATTQSTRDIRFGHVVFAAGDLDTSLFEEWVGSASSLFTSATVYTSRRDKAVAFSRLLRNLAGALGADKDDLKERIGFFGKKATPSVVQLEDGTPVYTIDISSTASDNIFFFAVRHSAYAQSTAITDDIKCLFDHPDSSPNERSAAFGRYYADEERGMDARYFWRFDPKTPRGPSICGE